MPSPRALVNFSRSGGTAPAANENEPRHERTEHRTRVVITLPTESLERAADRDALKKLKKRVTNILNDAVDAAPKQVTSRSLSIRLTREPTEPGHEASTEVGPAAPGAVDAVRRCGKATTAPFRRASAEARSCASARSSSCRHGSRAPPYRDLRCRSFAPCSRR